MAVPTDLADQRFLIIAGTSKAGTTSLFNYLANHPQICPSETKETRFFLDSTYPLPSDLSYDIDGPSAYVKFFDCARETDLRLEATPDYLYSPNAARLIRGTLANVKLIFILREPASRLMAMYNFGKKMGELSQAMSFDQFLEIQSHRYAGHPTEQRPHPVYYALQQGRYSVYLKPFFDQFDRSLIHVAFQEDLARDPVRVLTAIWRFAEIDEDVFESGSLKVMNKGIKVRSVYWHGKYWRLKQKLRDTFRRASRTRRMLRQIGNWVDAGYRKINVADLADVQISASAQAFVTSFYREEPQLLREMLGIEVPWTTVAASRVYRSR